MTADDVVREQAAYPSPQAVPHMIDLIDDAQGRLDATVRAAYGMHQADPTRLPGWTVGHVLTHVARHADATSRLIAGAAAGERPTQYVGGPAGRAAEIEWGADRPVDELLTDVRTSGSRCALVLRHVPLETWSEEIERNGVREPLTRALVSRWREIEIHHLDLGRTTSGDWPDEFVAYHLPREVPRLQSRAPEVQVPRGLDDHEVLAWLVGRGAQGLPELPTWA